MFYFSPRYIESDENLCLRGDKLREDSPAYIKHFLLRIFVSALNFNMIDCLSFFAEKVNFFKEK
jgi:hypothetical protein